MEVQDGIYYLTGIVCDENIQRMLGLAGDISQIGRNRPSSIGPGIGSSSLGSIGPGAIGSQVGSGRKANSARAKDLTKHKERSDRLEHQGSSGSKDKPHVCTVCGRQFTAVRQTCIKLSFLSFFQRSQLSKNLEVLDCTQ